MELDKITLEIPNPKLINENSAITDKSSEIALWHNNKKAIHLEFLIDPTNNKLCLRMQFLEEPIHNFRIIRKQVFFDGRSKVLDDEEIPLEILIRDDEQLYIMKNSMDNLEPGDEFRFVCDVQLSKANNTLSSKYSISMIEKMTEIACDQKFLDFTIKFKDGKELKVLKFILASKSPVFFKMFVIDMLESRNNEIFIPDVDYEIMKIIVNFIYNTETKDLPYHVFEVLIVADKYEILDLKKYCEMEVAKGLTKNIIADILIFADRYNAVLLKQRSIQFIQSNWDSIKILKEFECIYTYSNLILDIFETFDISNYPIKRLISHL